jgi:aspartate dehydrogenase
VKVGVLGYGAVGRFVAKWLHERGWLVAIYDVDKKALEKAEELGFRISRTIEDFLNVEMNVVVEAASQRAVYEYAEKILRSGRDVVILSAGALADEKFYEKIKSVAEEEGRRIYVPSGAIAGVDAIRAVADQLDRVVLITRKSPESLGVDEEGIVFEGSVRDAVRLFPRNLNVAATLGLAAGFSKVKVCVMADRVDANIHEIFAFGSFGEIRIVIKNRKLRENPKTSVLAALSVIRTVESIAGCVVI